MYESFYGLSSKPFQLNPDPGFYFNSKQHRRAKAYLDYGVMRNEGFIVITGEIGAGKTTVLTGLLNSLDRNKVVVGQLVTTQLEAEDTLRMVGGAFGFRVANVPKSELLITLEAFLINQASQGKRCLLVVDEAQNLSPRAVEELRMLSNYQLGTQSLLQSFLVGQPEFKAILQRPEMEQFRQRVAATCHIGPLDEEDTRRYVEHRLKIAGANGKPEITPEAFKAVYKASNGIPRRINTTCDRLLLHGFLAGKTRLDTADVEEVAREFERETGPSSVTHANGAASGTQVNGAAPVQQVNGKASPAVPHAGGIASPAVPADLASEFAGLGAEQYLARIERLENSLLRLERINAQTLALLQRMAAAKAPGEDKP